MHSWEMQLRQVPTDVCQGTNTPVRYVSHNLDPLTAKLNNTAQDVGLSVGLHPEHDARVIYNTCSYEPNEHQWTNDQLGGQVPNNFLGVRLGTKIPGIVEAPNDGIFEYHCRQIPSKFWMTIPPPNKIYQV